MKLEDIKEVYQSSIWPDVNQKLKEGFVITKIFNCKTKEQDMESIMPMYCLGKFKKQV